MYVIHTVFCIAKLLHVSVFAINRLIALVNIKFHVSHFGIELKSDGHHYPEKTMREVAQQRGRGGCTNFTQNAYFSRGYA